MSEYDQAEDAPGPKARTAEVLAFPERPEDRLRRALRRLEGALLEQGQAVAAFRSDLAALSVAVVGLDGTLQAYRANLGTAATEAERARDAARRLEARAEAMLAGQRG